MVNFQLPLSLLYYVFLLYRYISGSVYGGADVANNIYALAPALRMINYYLDAVNAITLVGAVIVMIWMKRFKTNAWKYYIGLLVGNAVAVVLYLIMYCIVIQINANFTNSSLTQYVITITNTIWTTGLMGVINYIYFKKRDHLFTN